MAEQEIMMILIRKDTLEFIKDGKYGPGGAAQIYIFDDEQVPDPQSVSHGEHKLVRIKISEIINNTGDDGDIIKRKVRK